MTILNTIIEEEKTCKFCDTKKPLSAFVARSEKNGYRGYRNICKECEAKRNYSGTRDREKANTRHRAHYEANKELYKQRDEKIKGTLEYRARLLLSSAVESGKVTKHDCLKCGDKKVEGHHYDYSKPLDVIWLCRKHHAEIHRKYTGGLGEFVHSAMQRAYKYGVQNTRADWLRSEIERVEKMKIKKVTEPNWNEGYNTGLSDIITRYKEELKVLEGK